MFTHPKHGGASTGSPVKKVPLNGLFKDGMWHCNCDPRLPASHFQVRKEGPTKGRWFYTCQASKENSCGFFLWDDKAVVREMRSVINNTRSEPDVSKLEANDSRYDGLNTKWIRNDPKREEGELGDWPLTQEDGKVAMAVKPIPPSYPETPRKAAKINPYMTPGSKRKREEDYLLTPDTTNKLDSLNVTSATRRSGGKSDGNDPFVLWNATRTPTTSRFRDALPTEAQDDNTYQYYDTTEEVMELLKDQHIDEETASELRQLLNKQALRVSGIAKGRDITRVALKTKDTKIAELQQKIAALETERDMDKTVIRHLKSDMAHSIASKRERG